MNELDHGDEEREAGPTPEGTAETGTGETGIETGPEAETGAETGSETEAGEEAGTDLASEAGAEADSETGAETGDKPVEGAREKPATGLVIDLRHGRGCKRITVRAGKFKDLSTGRVVVTESEVGPTLGMLIGPPREVRSAELPGRRILRMASDHDLCQDAENKDFEDEARLYCIERIQERELPMHLVSAEVSLDRRKLIFFFTAEGRIDFRDLVKDLASRFRTRIEMRQIGSRDETKMIGGLGPCGQEVCCHRWLNQFVPISIKMAKQQDLSLNPAKISGLCGRLMCCLVYEYDPRAKAGRKRPAAPAPGERAPAPKPAKVREPEETVPEVSAPEIVAEKPAAAAPQPAAEPAQKNRRGRRRRRKKDQEPQQAENRSQAPREPAPQKQGEAAPGAETEPGKGRRRGRRRRPRKKGGGGGQGQPSGQNPTGSDRPSGGDN